MIPAHGHPQLVPAPHRRPTRYRQFPPNTRRSVERLADKLQARKRLSASSAGSTASVSAYPITRAHFVAHRGFPSQPESSPAKWHDVRQRSKRSPVCNRRPRDSDAPPGNTTFATPACPSNALPISCEGRQVMLDDSTGGAARRPSFISKAARPRLRDPRRRVDRPSSAATACSTALEQSA